MKANIGRWIIFLLALSCVVQAASALNVKTEKINPESGALEPGQQVTAHYVLSYNMVQDSVGDKSLRTMNDEILEFSTGLQNPSWDFTVYRGGTAVSTLPTRSGNNPKLMEYEISYGADAELDVQLRGTVPKTGSSNILIVKIEHLQGDVVKDTYSKTRDVVNPDQVVTSLSVQQQRLKDLKTDIDDKTGKGVDVSAAQAKYDAANQALTSAASVGPSQAAGYIATATKAMDEAKSLLDEAWARKEVSDAGAAIESLDGRINYFVENRSMGGDPRVVSIVTKRESAVQFYSQAKDNLNANNYPLARSKATEGLKKANEALGDADALREKIGEGFNLGGNLLLYVGIGVIVVLAIVGAVIYRKKTRWDELG
jgi:hypothetical protein